MCQKATRDLGIFALVLGTRSKADFDQSTKVFVIDWLALTGDFNLPLASQVNHLLLHRVHVAPPSIIRLFRLAVFGKKGLCHVLRADAALFGAQGKNKVGNGVALWGVIIGMSRVRHGACHMSGQKADVKGRC